MDKNEMWVKEQKILRTIKSLEKNNMEGFLVNDEKELLEKLKSLIKEGDTVSVGGSMTLFETGVIDFLRSGNYNFLDRYKKGLKPDEIKDIFRKSFMCDDYIVSSNAVTENGELYNVDGTGNRVAAMMYGPDQVIVIIGVNKIVRDIKAAIDRVKYNAAPANTKRLDSNTPCTRLGYCVDCKSDNRICNEYSLIKRQKIKGRIKVIILNKDLGY
ncbi:lactate utilization protein [Clostridium sp.]|jgi:L-lactate utilization protein LutB|uniref:lactate utilization protein n=1 Tax=Clostridium sp. TaxID=1506 RepID=UPI003A5BC55B